MFAFQFLVIFPTYLCLLKINLNFQADIHNLEAEIKECKAELQKATGARPIHNTHLETVCGDSKSGSEDDIVESTQKKEISPNKMWLVWQYTVFALLILCPSHYEN
jgi:hypothetical protein